MVLSQRLALARCRFSFSFAQEKAWVRLEKNATDAMRGQFDDDLNAAIGQIAFLKQKMNDLEENNEALAD